MNDVWHSTVINFGCISSRILWIKFKFSRWWGTGPMKEMVKKGTNDMDRILDRVGNSHRLCILGNLNGWIGDRTRTGITGTFGVPGDNDNGRRVVEFCAERGMCVSNTHFEHRSLHKYTRVARDQDGVEVKSMIDLLLVNVGIYVGCEGGERNWMRPLRPPCYIV